MNIISVKNSDIQVLQQDIKEHIVETNFMINLMFIINKGWIQHDLVGGGGGGGVCPSSSGAELCRSCVPPTHQHASLLQSLA